MSVIVVSTATVTATVTVTVFVNHYTIGAEHRIAKRAIENTPTLPTRTITWPDLVSEKAGTTLVNVLWQLCSDQSAEPEARAATVTQCQGQLTSGSLTFTLFTFFAFLAFGHLEFYHCQLLLNYNIARLEET